MKILYVSGYTRMIIFNKLIPKALRENGYEVYEFDWNSIYKFNKSIKILSNDTVNRKINESLLRFAQKVNPDFIFILKGEPISISTLVELGKTTDAVLFNWFGDDPWEFPSFSGKVANYYNYFFTYDPYSVKLYNDSGQKNAFHLCYGYDPDVTESLGINENDLKKYKCEVAFIGSYYPKRDELLNKLIDKYDFKIWGRGWKNSLCSEAYQGNALYGTEMLKAMKSCDISLNIHKGFEEGVEASGEGLNLRVIEGAACGSFQLSNNQADIKNRFDIGNEIAVYDDWKDAEDKIDFYLNNPEKRKKIAGAGHRRFLQDHTLKKRMSEMMSFMINEG